ncbi:hypothetical protein BTW28_00155 [Citrobacter freundii]|nr:hypothetical protein BTW28_00155 [Citrobacter freundii]
MKIFRPLWTKGILLSPQYFQQQTLLNSRDDQGIAQMSVMLPWGVWRAEFDSQVLTQGQLKPLWRYCLKPIHHYLASGCTRFGAMPGNNVIFVNPSSL